MFDVLGPEWNFWFPLDGWFSAGGPGCPVKRSNKCCVCPRGQYSKVRRTAGNLSLFGDCLGFPLLPGAGYEWEDDFPLHPLATSSELSDSPPPRSVPKTPDPKPAAPFSRFTVSPSSVSRFSITHISDSDMDSVGGGSPKQHLSRIPGHSCYRSLLADCLLSPGNERGIQKVAQREHESIPPRASW